MRHFTARTLQPRAVGRDMRRHRSALRQRLAWLCLGLVAIAAGAGCDAPRWDFEYGFGQQRATGEKKAMLLYFTDLMASPHYEFDKQVLQQPVVQRELTQLVNVALSHQWGPAPKQFNVLKPEVCIMCQPDGSELARIEVNPPPTAEAFAAWLRDMRAKAIPPPATAAQGK